MAGFVLDITLLLDLAIILISATALCYVITWLKQPPLLAYLLTGIIIGPLALGRLGLTIGGIPLGIHSFEEVLILSELGIAFLLFSVGVEIDFTKMSGVKKLALIGTVMQVVITALFVVLLSQVFGLMSFDESLYVGIILAFSSTMVVIKQLSDKMQINALHGRIMIGFLLMQDILVIIALPLLIDVQGFLTFSTLSPLLMRGAAFVVLFFVLGKFVYPLLFKGASKSSELLYLAAVSSCFIFIYIAYILEFPIAIGAFLAGLSLSTLPYNLEVGHKLKALRDFFATIFFVTLGMQINFEFLSFPIVLLLFIIAVVFLIKPIIYFLITLFSGYGGRIAFVVALSLTQVSEFSFIIASQGYAGGTGVLAQTPGLYSLIISVIAISMLLTPYFFKYSDSAYVFLDRLNRRFLKPFKNSKTLHKKLLELEYAPDHLKDHIVIVGGGTMGSGITSLLSRQHEIIVIDHDSEIISNLIKKGINSLYGSADNSAVWDRAHVAEAKLLVLAIPDINAALYMLEEAKKVNPDMHVFARASRYKDALRLYEKGADFVIIPKVVATNVLLKTMYNFLETGKISEVAKLKDEYLQYLREKAKEETDRPIFYPLDSE